MTDWSRKICALEGKGQPKVKACRANRVWALNKYLLIGQWLSTKTLALRYLSAYNLSAIELFLLPLAPLAKLLSCDSRNYSMKKSRHSGSILICIYIFDVQISVFH